MPSLRLLLLGAPRFEREGVPLRFDTRKNMALVAYLAVTGLGPGDESPGYVRHTRDALITLLWPELEPSRARAGLRRNLSVLKKALGGEWLVVDGEIIGTDRGAGLWLDVAQFHNALGAWQRHRHPEAEVCPECLITLAEAAELYRGGFMEGFSLRDSSNFDEWQFFQTEGLRQELASALERLVHGHTAQGMYEPAIAYARRWLALDSLQEPVYRHLMQLYAWSGQRAAALRQYGECQRVLEEELGVPPEEETTQLFRAIKENQDLAQPGEHVATPSRADILNNRYRLGAELGRGGTGVVYRAHDVLLDRDIAVKVLSTATLGTEGRARLLDEARAAARLSHPNIVAVYDAGEADGRSYIVMERVEGQSLYERRPGSLDEVLSVAQQISSALEHAHSQGIVHRDLKPENVVVTADGTAKLTDFGLARPVASRITSEGLIVGTVFYLAPELALGQPFDGRADLYALGVMLYEWTTGQLPFTARQYGAASLLFDIQGARAYHQGEVADPEQVGVRALDELTLAVELEGPTNYFPFVFAFTPMFAVPRHVVQAHGDEWAEPDNIVTNGPFRLVAWDLGKSMTLERNQTYHGRFSGNLQRVECFFLSGQPGNLLEMYGEDRLDIFSDLPPAEMNRARQRYAGEYISGPRLSVDFLGFDTNQPPFDDRRVRRAFALATDRETLADVTLRGYAFPAIGGFVPPGMPGYSPGIGLPYNPDAARQLLAEAGYPGG